MPMSALTPLAELESGGEFIPRHVGIDAAKNGACHPAPLPRNGADKLDGRKNCPTASRQATRGQGPHIDRSRLRC